MSEENTYYCVAVLCYLLHQWSQYYLLVCELQLISVNIRTFVFAIRILGYNVGWWHTMTNRFHFFAWYSVLRSLSEAEHLSQWPIHSPIAIGLQKSNFNLTLVKFVKPLDASPPWTPGPAFKSQGPLENNKWSTRDWC